MTEKQYNSLTERIIGLAIKVHKELGPGLMESVYETCLRKLLLAGGFDVKCQVMLPVYFRGEKLDKHFFLDLLVENEIILELKSLEAILPIHEAHSLHISNWQIRNQDY